VTPEPPVLAVLVRGRRLPAFTAREPMVLPFVTPEPLVALAYKPRGPRVVVLATWGLLPVSGAREPLVLPCSNRELLVLAFVPLELLLPASAVLEPLAQPFVTL
jgi:hypothetical protein